MRHGSLEPFRRADLEHEHDRPPADVARFAALPGECRHLLLQVAALLDSIDYGAVVVVVQDGKAIQVEASEKIRLR